MKYDIIHLNGFMYAVDKKKDPNNDEIGMFEDENECWLQEWWNHVKWSPNTYKIVATNDPSLGLPLLPAVEEDELSLYIEFEEAALEVSKSILQDSNVFYPQSPFTPEQKSELRLQRLKDIGIWQKVTGYKAAKAKQFTEEFLEKIRDLVDELPVDWTGTGDPKQGIKDELDWRKRWNSHIESLKPKPVAVELEMEIDDSIEPISTGNYPRDEDYAWKLKVDSTNHVNVKQWYYE